MSLLTQPGVVMVGLAVLELRDDLNVIVRIGAGQLRETADLENNIFRVK